MENLAEALKMAFAIMMFVLALTLSISCFSQANTTVKYIISERDRETEYTYVEPSANLERIVGVETVIPSMYKAYKENFKILFLDRNENPLPLYYKTDSDGNIETDSSGQKITVNYIDLEQEILPNATEAINHLNILLGPYPGNDNKYAKQFMSDKREGLYKYLEDKQFKEVLGEYYQEDIASSLDENMLDINKTKKRVITYILQN